MPELNNKSLAYYKLLSEKYPTSLAAKNKIISLSAELTLPKTTEHFVSDLHGEFNSFSHVIRNASGVLRRYIKELFPHRSPSDRQDLATLVYYPEEKLDLLEAYLSPQNFRAFLYQRLQDVTLLLKRTAAKCDHQLIEESFPKDQASLLSSLILEDPKSRHKGPYMEAILKGLVDTGLAKTYILTLCQLVNRFAVQDLHVIGDIFDRGPEAEKIMDFLMAHPRVDVQWGNHDILWIGAASGSYALMLNALRIALRYDVMDTLEDGYGINLVPLFQFAQANYKPSKPFAPKVKRTKKEDSSLQSQVHKAVSLMQFKAEGQAILRNPAFKMEKDLFLDKINFDEGTVLYDGQVYPLLDWDFPTLDPKNPYAFSPQEEKILRQLSRSFLTSDRLQSHIQFLMDQGGMYKLSNENLLFHGCIPLNEDFSLKDTTFTGKKRQGRALLDWLNRVVSRAFYDKNRQGYSKDLDILYYLWAGSDSPLSGKDRVTTFARYLIADKKTHKETKNPYYQGRKDPAVAQAILEDFGLDAPSGRIINGHTPVKRKEGESPILAGGKVLVIDGGFAPLYHETTGTAGYTLISNSYGLLLATHKPIPQEDDLIKDNRDIVSQLEFVEKYPQRRLIRDSHQGQKMAQEIEDLKILCQLFEEGWLKEKNPSDKK
ncbi:MAG: fructose-bisphosphatase class III [Tissierellia bacterium]|nr:fructose-bisphosphatase class III [Tissierellia bacterium]